MAKQSCQTSKGGGFHLEVAYLQLTFACLVTEGFHLLVLVRVLYAETNLSSLWTVEAAASDSYASQHFFTCHLLYEGGVCCSHVRCSFLRTPVHVADKCLFHVEVAYFVASGIVVEQAVEADALDAGDEGAKRGIGLQTAAGTDADYRECAVLWLVLTLLEVDVGKGIQLVHRDVDVVATNACAEDRNALALVEAGDGVELSVADAAFLTVEVRGNGVNATRVADQYDAVSQLFGLDVKMEDAVVFVDDEFGWFVSFHRYFICPFEIGRVWWHYLFSSKRRISFSRASLSAARCSKAVSVRRI